MFHYKLIIAYDGTRYNGWQRQSDAPEKTIQGKIENVLSIYFDEMIQIIGSGRTDAGVHAKMQTANFHANTNRTPLEIQTYLAAYLPKDICILKVTESSPRFHARYNCIGKTYTYTIDNHSFADPFSLRFAHHVNEPLNLVAMKEAASHLVGTHDFQSFTTMKSKKKSTIKTITSIDISENDGFITFTFSGNGFLQHMVRILSGTLIEVGLGQRRPDTIPELLDAKQRALAGTTAPACGLCLVAVKYD